MTVMERHSWEQLPVRLTALAAGIESRQPTATLIGMLEQTQALCEIGASAASTPTLKQILSQVETATQTWQQVWSRLGVDREFRLAVAREARLWAKRLAEHAKP